MNEQLIVKVTNIVYEPYDEDDGYDVSQFPQELNIPIPNDITCPIEIEDYVSDEISNITGFCHEGFTTNAKELEG